MATGIGGCTRDDECCANRVADRMWVVRNVSDDAGDARKIGSRKRVTTGLKRKDFVVPAPRQRSAEFSRSKRTRTPIIIIIIDDRWEGRKDRRARNE